MKLQNIYILYDIYSTDDFFSYQVMQVTAELIVVILVILCRAHVNLYKKKYIYLFTVYCVEYTTYPHVSPHDFISPALNTEQPRIAVQPGVVFFYLLPILHAKSLTCTAIQYNVFIINFQYYKMYFL